MKCEIFQRELLLNDAGELPTERQQKLEAHLRNCPTCLRYSDDLKRLRENMALRFAQAQPDARIERLILAEAARTQPRPAPQALRFWLPALAALLALGVFLLVSSPNTKTDTNLVKAEATEPVILAEDLLNTAWDAEFEQELAELYAQIALLEREPSDSTSVQDAVADLVFETEEWDI